MTHTPVRDPRTDNTPNTITRYRNTRRTGRLVAVLPAFLTLVLVSVGATIGDPVMLILAVFGVLVTASLYAGKIRPPAGLWKFGAVAAAAAAMPVSLFVMFMAEGVTLGKAAALSLAIPAVFVTMCIFTGMALTPLIVDADDILNDRRDAREQCKRNHPAGKGRP